jgi:DNA polymerase-4
MATGEAKPNGELFVPEENVKPFMFPLSIRKIPMIGNKTYQLLRSMGIVTIETLSKIPVEMMEKVMGKNGIIIWKKANGIDPTPVIPYSEAKSISTERTFDKDTIDVARLKEILTAMVEKISFELRQAQKLTACVTVKIRYSNFDTETLQRQIPYSSFDHELIPVAQDLFKQLYKRRMLVRLIGVRFSHLVPGVQQLNLFESTPEMTNLYMAMDKIRNRYGRHVLKRAICF